MKQISFFFICYKKKKKKGTQILKYVCTREHTQTPVPEKRCHALEKPRETQVRCNTTPCLPR